MYFDAKACGNRIRTLRTIHSMTQLQLAIQLNLTDSNLCHIEKGNRSPSIDLLIMIAELFKVSLDYLILGKSDVSESKGILAEADAAEKHIQQIQHIHIP